MDQGTLVARNLRSYILGLDNASFSGRTLQQGKQITYLYNSSSTLTKNEIFYGIHFTYGRSNILVQLNEESNHVQFSLPYLQVLRQACHQFPHFISLLAACDCARYNIMKFTYETKRMGCITSGELNEENFPESGAHVPQIKFISVGTFISN